MPGFGDALVPGCAPIWRLPRRCETVARQTQCRGRWADSTKPVSDLPWRDRRSLDLIRWTQLVPTVNIAPSIQASEVLSL